MGHNDVSEILLSGLSTALDIWQSRFDGESDALYWVLRAKAADTNGIPGSPRVLADVPAELRSRVNEAMAADRKYWDNVRYANLDRVTQLWGVVVNAVRVAADSPMATDGQRAVFKFPAESIVDFFRSCRERMEIADALFHAFKPMPAPECQALAALLNVHVDAPLDVPLMKRIVLLLDDEGPLSEQESADLATLSNTDLVSAAFRGLRGS